METFSTTRTPFDGFINIEIVETSVSLRCNCGCPAAITHKRYGDMVEGFYVLCRGVNCMNMVGGYSDLAATIKSAIASGTFRIIFDE